MKITTDEILAALRDFKAPAERPTGAFTTEEAAQSAGLGISAMRQALRQLWQAGRLETVRFQMQAMNGKITTTIGYRVKVPATAGR